MTMQEFTEKVQRAVASKLGNAYDVKYKMVQKNNGVFLHGLLIMTMNQNICPTIYLDSFYEAYEAGGTLGEIVECILKIYREGMLTNKVDMEFFHNYDSVKDRICYRLILKEQNTKLLNEIPHVDFLDLSIVFFYAYQGEELGKGSILIHNTHLDMWNTDSDQLLKLAQENTPRIFPWEVNLMSTVIAQLMQEEGNLYEETEENLMENLDLKILSNESRIQGAACILYPELMEQLAEQEEADLYILPSSIHEVILLPASGEEDVQALRDMVREVNATQLSPEEKLSDSVYYYQRSEKEIKIIS